VEWWQEKTKKNESNKGRYQRGKQGVGRKSEAIPATRATIIRGGDEVSKKRWRKPKKLGTSFLILNQVITLLMPCK
jgi:hypothetical protein